MAGGGYTVGVRPESGSTESADAAAVLRLERLRELRAPRMRAVRLDATVVVQVERLRKLRRRLGGAGAAWAACCPEELLERTMPIALQGGVLKVTTTDASVRYRVDRWLRGGGLEELGRASAAPVRRVRLEIRPG